MVAPDLDRLFVGRLDDDAKPGARDLGPTTWLVSGGSARPLKERAGMAPRVLPAPVSAPPSAVETLPLAPANGLEDLRGHTRHAAPPACSRSSG